MKSKENDRKSKKTHSCKGLLNYTMLCYAMLCYAMLPGGRYSSEFSVRVCRPVPQILTQFQTKLFHFPLPFSDLAPVVQRPDNIIQWISHYPTVSIYAKISVFPHVQANMHTLTTAKFGSVRKPWTTFNVNEILDPG